MNLALYIEKILDEIIQLIPDFKLAWLARTTRKNLPRELDFLHEAENAEKIRLYLKDIDFVKVPKIEYNLSTSRLLVMDYMPGTQINDKKELNRITVAFWNKFTT